jgi:hypothetical protein
MSFLWLYSHSQTKKKVVFDISGLSIHASKAILPYGISSINEISYEFNSEGDHDVCNSYGISYFDNNHKLGFYVDFFDQQQFRYNFGSSGSLPFYIDSELYPGTIHTLYSQSKSFNYGFIFGSELTDGLQFFAKVGLGNSIHNYELWYNPDAIGSTRIYDKNKTKSFNYFFGTEMRYYPRKYIGVRTSLGFSDGVPICSIGLVGRLIQKKEDITK